LIDSIDQLLPQTQCGLCTFNACRPYAESIVFQNESIDKCPPGGVKTLLAIADLLQKDPTPFMEGMAAKTKAPSIAFIREDECIGCTKCIQACPVDAILGGAKKMHTIIASECTGCELCVKPCPVDCIDMLPIQPYLDQEQKNKADNARNRFIAKLNRNKESINKDEFATLQNLPQKEESINARKNAIFEAMERVKLNSSGSH
jgi:electron transport complex protein RnfB